LLSDASISQYEFTFTYGFTNDYSNTQYYILKRLSFLTTKTCGSNVIHFGTDMSRSLQVILLLLNDYLDIYYDN
jgi:hypothetical protein